MGTRVQVSSGYWNPLLELGVSIVGENKVGHCICIHNYQVVV